MHPRPLRLAALCLLLSLPALAQEGDGLIKLAAPGLSGVNLGEKEAEFFNEYFAEKLSARGGIKITTASEVQAVLGLERQKQLLGCEEDSACLTEIAGALGVDGIVIGSVARFGDRYGVNLKVIDAKTSEKWGAVSGQVEAERGVLTFLEDAAIRIAKDVKRGASAPPAGTAVAEPPPTSEALAGAAADAADVLALKQAAPRHMTRLDIFLIGGGYEYRVLDFLRVGIRGRILGLATAHLSEDGSNFLLGADAHALIRFEPMMTRPTGFALHVGFGGGRYAWYDEDAPDNVAGQASLTLSLGAELVLYQAWRVGFDLTFLPQVAALGRPGSGAITLNLGRTWQF